MNFSVPHIHILQNSPRIQTSMHIRRQEQSYQGGHMKETNICLYTKGGPGQGPSQHLPPHQGGPGQGPNQRLPPHQWPSKLQFHTKGVMELARGPSAPNNRRDLGWGHRHFSVGYFGLKSGHPPGAWWQQIHCHKENELELAEEVTQV